MADTKLENMTATTTPALTDLAYLVVPGAPSVDRKITLANLHKILGGVTDITYANLVSAIGGATLTPGTLYRITDYATKHYIVDSLGTRYSTIITGTTEPLIVLATSTSTIDKQAYSPAHPEDIIHYDWNPANWMDDLSFVDDVEGTPPVIVTGFKGVITFRHDTLLDNYAPCDFRECKSRRWKPDVSAFNIGTTYYKGDKVKDGTSIFLALQDGSGNLTSDLDYWTEVLDLSENEYWITSPTSGLLPAGADYDDFKLFAESQTSQTYERACRSNHFEGFKDNGNDYDSVGTYLPNNVIFLIDYDYFGAWANKVGQGSSYNTFLAYELYDNLIQNYCSTNIFNKTFSYNFVGNRSANNIVGVGCLSNFFEWLQNARIGKAFTVNSTRGGFSGNYIGHSVSANSFDINCNTNVICHGFTMNSVLPGVSNTDFSGGTHVAASYTCEIFKRSDGTVRLRYTDGSDVLTVVAPNA